MYGHEEEVEVGKMHKKKEKEKKRDKKHVWLKMMWCLDEQA